MTPREPLTKEALIAMIGGVIIQGFVVWGVPLTTDQQAWLSSVVTVIALLYVVLRVRPQVTPLDDPRTKDGTPLVPQQETPERG